MYSGMDADNKQATVMNILVAHEKHGRQDGLQHRQDDLREERDELIAVHKEAENFKLENQKSAATPGPVPPGRGQVLRRKGRQAQLSPVTARQVNATAQAA